MRGYGHGIAGSGSRCRLSWQDPDVDGPQKRRVPGRVDRERAERGDRAHRSAALSPGALARQSELEHLQNRPAVHHFRPLSARLGGVCPAAWAQVQQRAYHQVHVVSYVAHLPDGLPAAGRYHTHLSGSAVQPDTILVRVVSTGDAVGTVAVRADESQRQERPGLDQAGGAAVRHIRRGVPSDGIRDRRETAVADLVVPEKSAVRSEFPFSLCADTGLPVVPSSVRAVGDHHR